MPTEIIDRDSIRGWKASGSLDTFDRAKVRVKQLLESYKRPELDPDQVSRLHAFVLDLSKQAGVETLPVIEGFQPA